jgi:hypothetical protein
MYSSQIVNERLEIAAQEFGFTPVYNSVAEIDAFNKKLESEGKFTLDDTGRPTGVQNLSAEDAQFILNQQILCQCDAVYFLTRFAFIKNEQNIIERFSFRVPQRLIFDIICDLEMRRGAIEICLLKARQLGSSSVMELLIAHRIIFSYGINAIIGSADQTKTALMANMLFLCYDMCPIWLVPKSSRRVESDKGMLVFGSMSSGVSFQHGKQTSGIARGTTPTAYHLAECASFSDAVNQIEASLFKAVHASPHVFGVLESTGEGDKGWWPDTWRSSVKNWESGRARLCPLFLPWFCGVNIWPTPTWRATHPVPYNWQPHSDTRLHVAKSELYVRSSPLLERHLIAHQERTGELQRDGKYHMPQYQQWFWEVDHEEHKEKGIEGIFLQEMAGDPEESLQRSTESVFGHATVLEIETHRKREYEMYALSGQSIERDHEPSPEIINYDIERIPVRYQSMRGDSWRWELVPLKLSPPPREDDCDDATGILFVWHHPQPGVNYSIGVDTGRGIGEDSTVISVWSVGYDDQPDVQCAEFASAYVSHVESFAFVMAIASYYKSQMDPEMIATSWREPYVSIEQIASVGDVAQMQMAKMGYNNFHMMGRYDDKNPAKSKRRSHKRGWYTSGWSRPILTGEFVHWIKNNWSKVNSPWLLEEMKTFEAKVTRTGREKMEHEDGAHDDRVFAAAMAVFCPHDLDPMAQRSKRRSIDTDTLPTLNLQPYQPHTYNISTLAPSETLEDLISADLDRYQ